MKSIIFVLSLVFIGFSASAQGVDSFYREPRPVFPRMMDWKASWEKGTKIDEAQLKGIWKLIGRAAASNCSFYGHDAFDQRGMKGFEGGHPVLEFTSIELPGYVREMFTVKLTILGGRTDDQGPYEAQGVEPQFSLWGYDANGKVGSNSYTQYSCRLDAKNPKWLICMMSVSLKQASKADDKLKACAAEDKGLAYIFSKEG